MAYLADNSEEQLDLFGEVTALMGALEVGYPAYVGHAVRGVTVSVKSLAS